MEFKDYYKIMGLARNASPDDVKQAYRKLSRKFHPDVSKEKNAEVRFKELNEANEVLKDPEKRASYDQLGANWREGQNFRPPPEWRGGAGRGAASGHSDFFDAFFRQGFGGATHQAQRPPPSTAGEDRHAKIQIDLEDSYSGAARTLNLRLPEMSDQGHVIGRDYQVTFTVPKGIREGQQIRLAGQGRASVDTGQPGDLYLDVAFHPHPLYRAVQHDVYMDLPLSPWEAALGAEVQAPTPTGLVALTIPPGSSGGNKLRLKGRGLPGRTPGDFYFVLAIALPAADTDSAKSFYEGMAQHFSAFQPRAKLGDK